MDRLIRSQKRSLPDIKDIKKKIITLKKGVNSAVQTVKYDVKAVRERDPAARSDAEVLLLYSGMHALLAYRVSHKLYEQKHFSRRER